MRLSAIGLETTHGYIYPAMINGYDETAMRANALDIVSGIFPTAGKPSVFGAEIVACYDVDPERARKVAEACKIARVCATLDEAYQDVDGVVITSGEAALHRELADRAFARKLPVFVDKPLALTAEDAEAIADQARRTGTPLFCTSAVRFADQTVALKARLSSTVGTPLTAHVIGNGEYENYAVHSLEFLFSVWGPGVRELRSLGRETADLALLSFDGDREAVWQLRRDMVWGFDIHVFGTEGVDGASIRFPDRYAVFRNTAAEIVTFMATGRSPVPPSETVEIVRILDLVQKRRGSPAPHQLIDTSA